MWLIMYIIYTNYKWGKENIEWIKLCTYIKHEIKKRIIEISTLFIYRKIYIFIENKILIIKLYDSL